MPHPIRVGVGGWTYEPWRNNFYPAGWKKERELEYASRRLTAIEVNGTFYRTQTPATFRKWAAETPENFVFTVKAHRVATSRKTPEEMKDSIDWFMNSGVLELKEKLGPVNWQFHPSKKFDAEYFGAFLRLLPREKEGRRVRHAIEVRHASFKDPAFIELLRAHSAALVSADEEDWPQEDVATCDFAYARLQRSRAEEPTGYPAKELDAWVKTFKDWAKKRDVFAFFISGAKEHNPAAAQALIARL